MSSSSSSQPTPSMLASGQYSSWSTALDAIASDPELMRSIQRIGPNVTFKPGEGQESRASFQKGLEEIFWRAWKSLPNNLKTKYPLNYPQLFLDKKGMKQLLDTAQDAALVKSCQDVTAITKQLKLMKITTTPTTAEDLTKAVQCIGTRIDQTNPQKAKGPTRSISTFKARNKELYFLPARLCDISGLQSLDVGQNNLGSIPAQLSQLSDLTELHADGCSLSEIPESLKHAKQLRMLDLPSNRIATIPDWISNLSELRHLLLRQNALHTISQEIDKLTHLKVLDVSANNLSILPKCRPLKSLSMLLLQQNHIAKFPKWTRSVPLSSLQEQSTITDSEKQDSEGTFSHVNDFHTEPSDLTLSGSTSPHVPHKGLRSILEGTDDSDDDVKATSGKKTVADSKEKTKAADTWVQSDDDDSWEDDSFSD